MKNRITIKNTIASISLQIITIISGFIIPRLLLKTFGSEVNGLVSSLNQFLNYITLIEGVVTGVILASLYKPINDKNITRLNSIIVATNNFFRKIAIAFVIYTILLSVLYPIIVKTNFPFEYVCTLTLILSINLFMQYFFSLTWKTLLKADKKVYYTSLVQILCIILNTISIAVLIKIWPNIHAIKLGTALIYMLQPLLFNIYVNKHYKIDKKADPDKKALSQRWDGFGINIAGFIHNNTDAVVLTLFTDLKSVSIYSVYYLVTSGLKRLIQSISEGITPTLGHAYASKDKERLNNVFDLYEFVIFIATFIFFTAGGLLITPFIQIYTNGINDANYYQLSLGWLLILSEMSFCIKEPHVNMAYSANKFKEISKYAYIEAILNIVLSIILVRKLGVIGVAIGTLIAMTFRTIIHIVYLKKHILYRNIWKTVSKLLVFGTASIICIIISTLFFRFENINVVSWIVLAIKNVIVIGIVYVCVVLIFYRKKIRDLLKNMKK